MSARFPCARCGRALTRRPPRAHRPRHIACPRCQYMMYDYPRAAAGVLVVRDDGVLLLRRAHPPAVGRLDIPGGFLEPNESIEFAARRELREETGLVLGPLTSLGMWWDTYALRGFGRFPTMNFYFAGRWRRGAPVAADDAASAAWVPFRALPRLRRHFAWRHMSSVLAAARAWARGARA